MDVMFSNRFEKNVWLTAHAQIRMEQRGISKEIVLDLVETGTVKHKDDKHLWIFKNYTDRTDNKLCAAVVIEEALVIKTLMTNWQEVGT
jgi:hypothetical protein